jgi:hypothetical protein
VPQPAGEQLSTRLLREQFDLTWSLFDYHLQRSRGFRETEADPAGTRASVGVHVLFSSVENVLLESVEVTDTVVRVEARTTAKRVACPGCGCRSGRIHGSYLRFPCDLPTAGSFVVVSLRVRRFVCKEDSCERKTFAEQVPGLTGRFGRRTERLRSTLCRSVLRSRDGPAPG